MARFSAGHALTEQEKRFAEVLHASEGKRVWFAFQRAFCFRRPSDGEFVCPPVGPEDYADGAKFAALLNTLDPIPMGAMISRATELSKQEHIRVYLQELRSPPTDLARGVLLEHMLGADTKDQRAAALEVLKAEDKLNAADATQRWIDICCEAGAEVVVPLPHELRKDHVCEACGHAQLVVIPLDVSFPMSKMFPKRGAAA